MDMDRKRSSSELKSMAKGALAGRYGTAVGAVLLLMVINFGVNMIMRMFVMMGNPLEILIYFAVSFVVTLLLAVIQAGLDKLFLNMAREEVYGIGDLFQCFANQPDRVIVISLLISLIGFACMLPGLVVLIPAIFAESNALTLVGVILLLVGIVVYMVLTLGYSMATYIYLDAPEKSAITCLRESSRMMKGNKGRLFYIQLSFIGVMLLGILACYIGILWVLPYMRMTIAELYRELNGELDSGMYDENHATNYGTGYNQGYGNGYGQDHNNYNDYNQY